MSFFQSTLLGLVQGLTEFLPVSSTAHLILIPWLLGWAFDPAAAFVFDILVQWGTLAAVAVYFARDLWQIVLAVLAGVWQRRPFDSTDARLGWLIAMATLPAALLGLLFKPFFEGLHRNPPAVAAILLAGAGLIFVVEYFGRRERDLATLSWKDALIIGSSQALALLPGVSRSAATISGGLARGLDRPSAARFSFLMSIPVLFAAGLVALKDLFEIPNFTVYLPGLALGMAVAAVVGWASIRWLLGYLARHSMNVFAWYRLGLGLLCLVVAFIRR
jgi:undecaprenyl-diphosphatase